MKLKQITTALLLLFVGVSVVFLVVKETRSKPEERHLGGPDHSGPGTRCICERQQ